MKQIAFLIRFLFSLVYLMYFVIFFGLISKAFLDAQSVFKSFGYFWVIANILLGAILCTHLILRLKDMWKRPNEDLIRQVKSRWKLYTISTIILLGLYLLRHELANLFFYAGFVVGRFFISLARNAYFKLFEIDLYNWRLEMLAWLFQWQFIFAVSESIAKFIRRKRG